MTSLKIFYHGNCIDGWFSAFVISTALKDKYTDIRFLPISPNQPRTWPSETEMLDYVDSDIILTDVMLSTKVLEFLKDIAKSVFCIDHHESTKKSMSAMTNAIHDITCCATKIAWKYYNPDMEIPAWIEQINRIDMWSGVTDDDRAMREIMNPLAHHEVASVFNKTEEFVRRYDDPEYIKEILIKGHEALAYKDDTIRLILKMGRLVNFTEDICESWGLSKDWVYKKGFLMDTTGFVIDSTEAGYIALHDNPDANFFCNYRRKEFLDKETRKQQMAYVYSVRAKPGMDLTIDGVFKGHKTSAGANIVKGTRPLPFV